MEVRFVGGRAEGRVRQLPDSCTAYNMTFEDGTTMRYVARCNSEAGDPRSGAKLLKFAYFDLESMTQVQVLARAQEIFDDDFQS